MSKLKINVVVAGRSYPINVSSEEEEEGIRKAAKNINDLVAYFEDNYSVSDKQDALTMCALQFASKKEMTFINTENNTNEALKKLNELNNLLDSHL